VNSSKLRSLWIFSTLVFLIMSQGARAAASFSMHSDQGLSVNSGINGFYEVRAEHQNWVFQGILENVSQPPLTQAGVDQLGSFQRFSYADILNPGLTYSITLYLNRPVVLFSEKGTGIDAKKFRFPLFNKYPKNLKTLSYKRQDFSPYVFNLSGDAPWVFFNDTAETFILSPANHFMISNNFAGQDQSLSTGIEPQVSGTASVLEFQAILVIDSGVNRAFGEWGHALTDLSGKVRPDNDSDKTLSTLGYWTDNRSSYWYNYSNDLHYAGTLQAIKDEFSKAGLKLGHFQLDSWWYVKGGDPTTKPPLERSWKKSNYKHGVYLYEAPPDLFARGLGDFQKSIALPLVTHSRWIDPTSPYSKQFKLSNQVSIDPHYWDNLMRTLQSQGVETYEQDWLNEKGLPRLDNLTDADGFLNEMSGAAQRSHINLQYCMPLPRHFLQGSRYSNLHSIRTSGDGFERGKWNWFLFGSQLASSLGIWPWVDVFFSQDRENLLLATLSGGNRGRRRSSFSDF